MSLELFASRRNGLLRTVLCAMGEAIEVRAQTEAQVLRAGQVHKGRISAVEPGLRAAFVDLVSDQVALLRLDDLPRTAEARPHLQPGCEIVVQIAREPLARKGARATGRVAIGGRRLVLLPTDPFRGVSRRIADPTEATRLRTIVLGLPGVAGWILRANAAGSTREEILDEAEALSARWSEVQTLAQRTPAPTLLQQAPDLLERTILDAPALDRLVIDDPDDVARAKRWLAALDPALASRVECWSEPRPLFPALGLDRVVERARSREVQLRSGGRLILQTTEACVTVDVDSGRSTSGNGSDALASQTNREAAGEIARQLRLRDLGGIVVIDFLETGSRGARETLLATLRAALALDPARTAVGSMDDFGLVALTRERSRAPFDELLTEPCPACAGDGRVAAAADSAVRALDALANLLAVGGPRPMRIRAHPDVATRLHGAVGHVAIERDSTLSPGTYVVEPVSP